MSMRRCKVAVARALANDDTIAAIVPASNIYACERTTVSSLPSIEVIGVASEQRAEGPLNRHVTSVEITVTATSEDDADMLLDDIVLAVRQRLSDATQQVRPIVREDGQVAPVALLAARWSISASDAKGVVRGAALACEIRSDDA